MAHTPGPWIWETNRHYHSVKLVSPKNGRCTVMDFVRWGMQDAQPRFSDRGDAPLGGIMHNAAEYDLSDGIMSNADARLIAAAPDLLEALQAIQKEPYGCPMCDSGVLRNKDKKHWPDCPYELARAAIAKANSTQKD